jgi:hypothetical protein
MNKWDDDSESNLKRDNKTPTSANKVHPEVDKDKNRDKDRERDRSNDKKRDLSKDRFEDNKSESLDITGLPSWH